MNRIFFITIFQFFIAALCAQNVVSGRVMEYGDHDTLSPIVGAVVQWKNTDVGAISDLNGRYSVPKISRTDTLVVIYQTYESDTIVVEAARTNLDIILSSAHTLSEVSVSAHDGAYISVKPILTTVITSEGLRKAACCNLSESFESTVAVDVEYSDAVSGAKQISMLGLAGVYSQILLENVPFIRLLANQFGLGFVPGTWMDAISVSKGISSVTNGYEAISGQINIDYKKPETNTERLFINLFGSTMGKGELNLNGRFDVGKKKRASTMFLLHTEGQFAKMDGNGDGFLDLPRNVQVNAMNRWDYNVPNKFEGRTWVNYLWEDRIGGQKSFVPKRDFGSTERYGLRIRTNKLDVVSKNGFLLKGEHESVGTIVAFTFHHNDSYFGVRPYAAQQLSGYANVLYSNRFGARERSKITAGASFQIDYLDETLSNLLTNQPELSDRRTEMVPGIFAEYSYSIEDKLVVMPGFRIDYNAWYKQIFWTPRLHVKWQIAPNSSLRASAGKGYRAANVLIENLSLLVSNRTFIFDTEEEAKLQPEEAYNAGASFVQTFQMKGGKSSFSVDYFYTHFINQTIIDMDLDAHEVHFYDLRAAGGRSFSHSVQAELTLNPIARFEIILAYRYNHVEQTTSGKLRKKALMSPHKALVNLSYATKFNKWKFNATLQYHSSMRLPDMSGNADFALRKQSPDYFILNAQITKKFKTWEFYIGGENLLNVKQKNPILAAENPFGENFDASVIYAPITGIMGYAGVRFTLK